MTRDNFRLGDWEVYPAEGQLRRDGRVQRLRPKAMDVLCELARADGALVTRDALLAAVWGERAVSDEPLTATISELRRVLDDRSRETRLIETVPKRGYRLMWDVQPLPPAPGAEARSVPADHSMTAAGWNRRRVAALLGAGAVAAMALVLYLSDGQGADSAAPRSVAVLPFTQTGTAAGDTNFGDGLAQEIMAALTRVDDLKVAARQSTRVAADRRGDLRHLREALDVETILDGSVHVEQGRLHVRLQLVDLRDGYNLWAESFERDLQQGFSLQTDIANAVAGVLQGHANGVALESAAHTEFAAGESYADYLQGRYLYENGRSEAELQAARSLLEAVTAGASPPAPALAALAGVHLRLADLGYLPEPAAGYRRARQLIERALRLNADLAEGHLLLGWIALYGDWSWSTARHHLKRALDLAPGDRSVLSANAALRYHLGALEQAARLARRAAERDPLSASAHYNLAHFLFAAGVHDAARSALARVQTLEPAFPGAGLLQAQLDLAAGNVEQAGRRHEHHPLLALVADALTAQAAGDETRARQALASLKADHATVGSYQIAGVHAVLGDTDEAFRWLDRAKDLRDPGLAELLVDPLLGSIRDDPRYLKLLDAVGLRREDGMNAPAVL